MPPPATLGPATPASLEDALNGVESRLAELGAALRARDASAIELQATELQRDLARAVEQFSRVARSGPIPPALRARLAIAGAGVASQREALARASAALDRAIDVLLPRNGHTLYSNAGGNDRSGLRGGVVQA